jgi:hypothetical protein
MKRGWENSKSPFGSASGGEHGREDPTWVNMPAHPYASAYSSLPNPFNPSPLQNEATFNEGYREPPVKRSRASEANGSEAASDNGDDDDDEEDEDEADDSKTGKKGKGKGDGKQKVKLTRGSR